MLRWGCLCSGGLAQKRRQIVFKGVVCMLKLPIPIFSLSGLDGCIELTMNEVWGFPDQTSFGGGYDAEGTLTIRAGAYSVSAACSFTTGELYRFSVSLQQCYDTLTGAAVLENTEQALALACEFDRLGHVVASGCFQAIPSANNRLTFEIHTDQTQVKEILSQLQTVFTVFGGNTGKRFVLE